MSKRRSFVRWLLVDWLPGSVEGFGAVGALLVPLGEGRVLVAEAAQTVRGKPGARLAVEEVEGRRSRAVEEVDGRRRSGVEDVREGVLIGGVDRVC